MSLSFRTFSSIATSNQVTIRNHSRLRTFTESRANSINWERLRVTVESWKMTVRRHWVTNMYVLSHFKNKLSCCSLPCGCSIHSSAILRMLVVLKCFCCGKCLFHKCSSILIKLRQTAEFTSVGATVFFSSLRAPTWRSAAVYWGVYPAVCTANANVRRSRWEAKL